MKRFFIWLKTKYWEWRFRFVDEDLCCCGENMKYSYDCGVACRSAKEYAVTQRVYPSGKPNEYYPICNKCKQISCECCPF